MLIISISDLAYRLGLRSIGRNVGLPALFTLVLLFFTWPEPTYAQNTVACEPEMARVTSVQGDVEIRWTEGEPWRAAVLEDVLCTGTTIRVGAYSRAALAFVDDSTLRLDQSTTLVIRGREQERRTLLDMIKGAIHFFSHRPQSLGIQTPFVNAAAEGTEFLIRVAEERTRIIMFEGIVLASNPKGEIRLGPNDAALIEKGQKPVPEIVIRPRDAVAWAVYVPDVFSDLAAGAEPGAYPVHLQVALKWARENNIPVALRTLDLVPPDERDASHEALRAAILLTVGRFAEAEAAIERALAQDEDAADAYAVRTIIHVTRNERAQALRDANRAVQLAPGSSTALIAQSYARQAGFDLEGARESLRSAVEKNPNDALAYARLAEIELSFADYDRANEAAKQATTLAPNLARTQTVLGFSKLAEIDTDAARKAFARAIAQNSADPLPHLGFGLATIRDGFLEAGRRDLEIAASLDPNNALIRSYLGKAYFEEKRGPKDATQFDIAKKLDPNDPTPWFYDAIRKQTENRPVEALRDLEKAIELNDNRAIYRSRLLLDEDRAARAVSLAKIYDNLGFNQLAINKATKSLSDNPSNHSAHRFLSDAYSRLPRHEIARASELLQSQLLQPLNNNPTQPSLPFVDINVSDNAGPISTSLGEFDSLFQRDRIRASVAGLAGDGDGNQGTLGSEIVASSLWKKVAFSAGKFDFKSDGFRPNNDIDDDIVSLFGQWNVDPKLSFQAEYRHRNLNRGDLSLLFDPDIFNQNTLKIEDTVSRLGALYSLSPNKKFLFSAIFADLVDRRIEPFTDFIEEGVLGNFVSDSEVNDKASQFEFQYIIEGKNIDVIGGIGRLKSEVEINGELFLEDQVVDSESSEFKRSQTNAYVYTKGSPSSELRWILGLGYSSFDQRSIKIDQIEPKVGIEWDVTDQIRLRGAITKSLKRPLVVDQTIEPTEVAGFNQFFDGRNGDKALRSGFGLDVKLSREISAGTEISVRKIDSPISRGGETQFEDRKEEMIRGYIYWTPNERWSVTFEPEMEKFSSKDSIDPNFPLRLTSTEIPVSLRFFGHSGLFSILKATYVRQNLKRRSSSSLADGTDDAVLIDAAIGYRLPRRRGALSLEIRNILKEKFSYQDDSFRASSQNLGVPEFIPESTVLLRASINF